MSAEDMNQMISKVIVNDIIGQIYLQLHKIDKRETYFIANFPMCDNAIQKADDLLAM